MLHIGNLIRGAALVLACCATVATAQPVAPAKTPAQSAADIVNRAADIVKRSVDASGGLAREESDQRNIEDAARIAREAARFPLTLPNADAGKFRPPPFGDVAPASRPSPRGSQFESPVERIILVSDSMSTKDLRAALEVASESGATVVFRGVRKGAGVGASMARMHGLGKGLDPAPSVVIDPRPFEKFGVVSVPTIVLSSEGEVVKVGGTLSMPFVQEKFDARQFGDFGARGPMFEIVEPDLLEEMRSRLESVDWGAKQKAAAQRAWQNFQLVPLPRAQASSQRLVDASVEIADDIKLPDGRLLAPGGTKFNPLEIVPFTKTLVIVDITDARQLAYAKRVADDLLNSNRSAVVMTTAMDRQRGWDAYREYAQKMFPHRVFILTPEVVARFGIGAVPSVVDAVGMNFRITETAAESLE